MREMGFIFAWPSRAVLEPVLRQRRRAPRAVPLLARHPGGEALAREVGTPVVAASHLLPENMFHNIGVRSEWLVDRTWRFFISTLYGRADHLVLPDRLRPREAAAPRSHRSGRRHLQRHPAAVPSRSERSARRRYRGRFLVLAVSRLATREADRGDRRGGAPLAPRRAPSSWSSADMGRRRNACGASRPPCPLPAEIRVVEEDDMPALMRSADLLVHAAEVELEGMALLEALGHRPAGAGRRGAAERCRHAGDRRRVPVPRRGRRGAGPQDRPPDRPPGPAGRGAAGERGCRPGNEARSLGGPAGGHLPAGGPPGASERIPRP